MRTTDTEPWRDLPASAADVIEPELGPITDEILVTIAREVPEYARPLEGSFGRGVRTGVTEALRQFVALIRDPGAGRDQGREVYAGLGSGELRQGRTLDALQSAYRVGARVAWRRIAAAARRAGLDAEVLSLLAESIFAYIEEISADSVEGYSRAQAQLEGERRRRRRELALLLLREPPAPEADVRAAAEAAGWALPRSAAAIACDEASLEELARRLPPDALTATVDGLGCVLVQDPHGPGRTQELEAAAQRVTRAADAGATPGEGLIEAEQHLAELMLFESRALAERIADRRLAPLAALTKKARRRFEETALAYLEQQGNAAATARALGIHPQTARYRLSHLRE